MKSKVVEQVRDRQRAADLRLTAAERLRRAHQIAEVQLGMFMTANGMTRREALNQLRVNRAKARRGAWPNRNR